LLFKFAKTGFFVARWLMPVAGVFVVGHGVFKRMNIKVGAKKKGKEDLPLQGTTLLIIVSLIFGVNQGNPQARSTPFLYPPYARPIALLGLHPQAFVVFTQLNKSFSGKHEF
jgi:hypothetical protein